MQKVMAHLVFIICFLAGGRLNGAENPSSISFGNIPVAITNGIPFPVTLRALNQTGAQADYDGPAELRVRVPSPLHIVVNRIDTVRDEIEFLNPGTEPIDISGFELQSNLSVASTEVKQVVPPGTVVDPGTIFRWKFVPQSSPEVSAYPVFVSKSIFNNLDGWDSIRLRKPSGELVEEVLHTGVRGIKWLQSSLTSTLGRTAAYQRVGNWNRLHPSDWTTNVVAAGTIHPRLNLPMQNVAEFTHSQSVDFIDGAWSGSLRIQHETAQTAALVVITPNGIRAQSESIPIIRQPPLLISTPNASFLESAPNNSLVSVTLPSPLSHDLIVRLQLDSAGEFTIPSEVIIRAGTLSGQFAITNLDDAQTDGTVRTRLIASAEGFSPGEVDLFNQDNETGHFYLGLPTRVKEGSGYHSSPGKVFLKAPAEEDILVILESGPLVTLPGQVIIPKGQIAASFLILIGDNSTYTDQDNTTWIQAAIPGWPIIRKELAIDDDDPFAVTLNLASQVWEGESTGASVTLASLSSRPTVVRLTTELPLEVPSELIIPAGEKSLSFTVRALDDARATSSTKGSLCARLKEGVSGCKSIEIFDNDGVVERLSIEGPVHLISGQPFAYTIRATTFHYQPVKTNLVARIRFLGDSNARVEPGEITLTNGVWSGTLTMHGGFLEGHFELSAGGISSTSEPITVIEAWGLQTQALAIVWDHVRQRMLVSSRGEDASSGRLLMVNPENGEVDRSIPLTVAAEQIAISKDGTRAWLGGQGFLIEVDLNQFQQLAEYPLDQQPDLTRVRGLCFVSDSPDRVLAAISTQGLQQQQLVLYEKGEAKPARVSALLPSQMVLLSAGQSNQAYARDWQNVLHLKTSEQGVELLNSKANAASDVMGFFYREGRIYQGNGDVLDGESLEVAERYIWNSGPRFLALSDDKQAVLSFESGRVTLNAKGSDNQSIEHALPLFFPGNWITVAQWPGNGLAVARGNDVWFFKSPFFEVARPDLKVMVSHPQEAILPTSWGAWQTNITLVATVTNAGPGVAFGTQLRVHTSSSYIGTLPPGETRTLVWSDLIGAYSVLEVAVSATSFQADLVPADNHSRVVIPVRSRPFADHRQVLIPSARLLKYWPATGNLVVVGDAQNRPAILSIVNPLSGQIEAEAEVAADILKVAPSANPATLYVQTAPNRIARWNVLTRAVESEWDFASDSVLDFIPYEGKLLVATPDRLQLFNEQVLLASVPLIRSDSKTLGLAGGKLWVVRPGEVKGYTVGSASLTVWTTLPSQVSTGNSTFIADADKLYFQDGSVLNVTTRQWTMLFGGGSLYLPDSANGSFFMQPFSGGIFRHDLATLERVAKEVIPTMPYAFELVRWGEFGLAALAGDQIVIFRSTLGEAVPVDLDIAIAQLKPEIAMTELLWEITVTNRSAATARRIMVELDPPAQLTNPVVVAPDHLSVYGHKNLFLEELPAHSSINFLLRGLMPEGHANFVASVRASNPETDTSNNSVFYSKPILHPESDLGIVLLNGPISATVGDEFELKFKINNAGPAPIERPALVLNTPHFEVVRVVGANPHPESLHLFQIVGGLAPGEGRVLSIFMVAESPGVIPLEGSAFGALRDTNNANNYFEVCLFIQSPAPLSAAQFLNFPSHRFISYNAGRREILAQFYGIELMLYRLRPESLEPLGALSIPGGITSMAHSSDGRYSWISYYPGRIARIDWDLPMMDLDVDVGYDPVSIFTPPSSPNALLVAPPGSSAKLELFINGEKRNTWEPGGFLNQNGTYLFHTSQGKNYYLSPPFLREFSIVNDQIIMVESLDHIAPTTAEFPSHANGKLFVRETVVDLEARTRTPSDHISGAASEDLDLFVAADMGRAGNVRYIWLRGTQLSNSSRKFGRVIPVPPNGGFRDFGTFLPTGENSALFLGDGLLQITSLAPGEIETAFQLSIVSSNSNIVSSIPFTINLALTNASDWFPKNAVLSLTIPDGLTVVAPAGHTGGPLSFELPEAPIGTNFTVQLKAAVPGSYTLHAQALSDLPDRSIPFASLQFNVAPMPVVLVENSTLLERQEFRIRATLSAAPPVALTVPFTVSPVTGQANDIAISQGNFSFTAGSTESTAAVFNNDTTPELDETFRLDFTSDQFEYAQKSARITLVNDDFPALIVANISLAEGHTSQTNAQLMLRTVPKAPFPFEVEYLTTGESASSGTDFESRRGVAYFPPNIQTNFVLVPVLGERTYETDEVFKLELINPFNLFLPVRAEASVTIRNDDLPSAPFITISRDVRGLVISASGEPGLFYSLFRKRTLSDPQWELLGSHSPAPGQNKVEFILENSAEAAFFRMNLN